VNETGVRNHSQYRLSRFFKTDLWTLSFQFLNFEVSWVRFLENRCLSLLTTDTLTAFCTPLQISQENCLSSDYNHV